MWQKLSAVIGFLILITDATQVLAQQQAPPQLPPWSDGYGWQFWWICPLMMLPMIVVVASIFFFARRHSANGTSHWGVPWQGSSHSALQILSERFARGEIQQDEYERKKSAILSQR